MSGNSNTAGAPDKSKSSASGSSSASRVADRSTGSTGVSPDVPKEEVKQDLPRPSGDKLPTSPKVEETKEEVEVSVHPGQLGQEVLVDETGKDDEKPADKEERVKLKEQDVERTTLEGHKSADIPAVPTFSSAISDGGGSSTTADPGRSLVDQQYEGKQTPPNGGQAIALDQNISIKEEVSASATVGSCGVKSNPKVYLCTDNEERVEILLTEKFVKFLSGETTSMESVPGINTNLKERLEEIGIKQPNDLIMRFRESLETNKVFAEWLIKELAKYKPLEAVNYDCINICVLALLARYKLTKSEDRKNTNPPTVPLFSSVTSASVSLRSTAGSEGIAVDNNKAENQTLPEDDQATALDANPSISENIEISVSTGYEGRVVLSVYLSIDDEEKVEIWQTYKFKEFVSLGQAPNMRAIPGINSNLKKRLKEIGITEPIQLIRRFRESLEKKVNFAQSLVRELREKQPLDAVNYDCINILVIALLAYCKLHRNGSEKLTTARTFTMTFCQCSERTCCDKDKNSACGCLAQGRECGDDCVSCKDFCKNKRQSGDRVPMERSNQPTGQDALVEQK